LNKYVKLHYSEAEHIQHDKINESIKFRRVDSVKIDDPLDVRDTLMIWCVGIVKEIIKFSDGKVPILLIHFDGWSKSYDELIPLNSSRLAPHGMYTSRRDVPKYQLHLRITENTISPIYYPIMLN